MKLETVQIADMVQGSPNSEGFLQGNTRQSPWHYEILLETPGMLARAPNRRYGAGIPERAPAFDASKYRWGRLGTAGGF